MSEWYSAGKRIDTLPLHDRAVQYGDGLFETIAIRDGKPRFLALHIERLQTGCERLGLRPPDASALHAELTNALAACDIDTEYATAKIIVTAGAGRRGYARPTEANERLLVGLHAAQPADRSWYRDGIRVRVCHTRLAPQPLLAGVKSLNRLEQVLARAEWTDPAIGEGLMLDPEGRLICGTMSNVFVVVDHSLATPAITRCGVSGIMRRHLLGELQRRDIDCAVRDIDLAEMLAATEVFITNSQLGIVPLRQIDEQRFAVGEVTRRAMQIAAVSGVAECAQ